MDLEFYENWDHLEAISLGISIILQMEKLYCEERCLYTINPFSNDSTSTHYFKLYLEKDDITSKKLHAIVPNMFPLPPNLDVR